MSPTEMLLALCNLQVQCSKIEKDDQRAVPYSTCKDVASIQSVLMNGQHMDAGFCWRFDLEMRFQAVFGARNSTNLVVFI